MNRKIITIQICFFAFAFACLCSENLIVDSDFEIWNKKRNLPYGQKWRWGVTRKSKLDDFVFKRNSKEKYSGKYSLHVKDSSTAKVNNSLYWQMSRAELKKYRGKIIRFSAWIKQISASNPKVVSIGLWCRTSKRKFISVKAGPETIGETSWGKYEVTMRVPENASLLRAYLHCASGWGKTCEAFFDNLNLKEVYDNPAEKGKTEYFFQKNGIETSFYFFNDKLQPFWNKKQRGGLYLEIASAAAFNGSKGIRLKTSRGSVKGAGVVLENDSLNKIKDTSVFPPESSFFEFMLRAKTPLLVCLNGQKRVRGSAEYGTTERDGWKRIRIPLIKFNNGKPVRINRISFEIEAPMNKTQQIEIDDICLVTTANISKPVYILMRPELKKSINDIVKEKDTYSKDEMFRPIIRNGIFYKEDKPIFFLGPWCSSASFNKDWGGKGKKRDSMTGLIYDEPFNKKIADILGLNSMQLSAASLVPFIVNYNAKLSPDDIKNAEAMISFLKGLRGMPFVMDFAWTNYLCKLLTAEGRLSNETLQQNSSWHKFVPFCSAHPQGNKIYSEYFTSGTRFTLEHGGNPFVYELFNESSYNCRCKFNRAMFKEKIRKKYGNMAKVNATWGTSFKSFAEVARTPYLENFPGLWVEWCKFTGERYAAILKKYSNLICTVDKRTNIYFTEQISITNILNSRGAGIDYTKIAQVLDVLSVEGGRGFGREMTKRSNSNDMEDALATHGELYSFILDMFTALSKNKKVILNNEQYCARFLFGKRMPTQKDDFVTTLWNEVFHGVSGSFFYAWGKRIWEWKTFEEAKKMVINGGYKAYHTLNPYAYPRKSLDGFKQFAEEIKSLAEIALPMPRLKQAKVAFVYSYPTLRMSTVTHLAVEKRIGKYYSALLYSQYPTEILMEEDIPYTELSKYDAIILPFMTNSYKQTLPLLASYVRKGGLVFCATGAFIQDEYGKSLDSSAFLGLSRKTCAKKENVFYLKKHKLPLKINTTSILHNAVKIITTSDGQPVLSLNKLGKGKVYYFAGETSASGVKSILSSVLKKSGIGKYADITSEDGKALEKIEFQIIDRGKKKLLFFVNWLDKGSRLVRVKLNLKDVQNSYLFNPFSSSLYLNKKKEVFWKYSDLQEGFFLILPPQKRVILLLTEDLSEKTYAKKTYENIRNIFQKISKEESVIQKELNTQEHARQTSYSASRCYLDVNHEKCVPLDLKKIVNMAFKDDVNGDRKGGWFDQGANDFRNMPLGRQVFANVPFEIINPEKNSGKSALILYGPARPYFPKKINGVPVNSKAKHIYFLHTAGWGIEKGKLCHSYFVRYQDGSSLEIPIRFGESISGWWNPCAVPDAKIAYESSNLMAKHIGLYCYKWGNPHPENPVKTIDIVASQNNIVPAVVAITLEK